MVLSPRRDVLGKSWYWSIFVKLLTPYDWFCWCSLFEWFLFANSTKLLFSGLPNEECETEGIILGNWGDLLQLSRTEAGEHMWWRHLGLGDHDDHVCSSTLSAANVDRWSSRAACRARLAALEGRIIILLWWRIFIMLVFPKPEKKWTVDKRLINRKGDIDFLAGGCWRTKNQVKKF